jgi:hypothetical protein
MNTFLSSPNISRIQKDRIIKSGYQCLFLLETILTETGFNLKISGSTLNIYTVSLSYLKFSCDCRDSLYCESHNILCKHICFVICSIGKIETEALFTTRILNIFDSYQLHFRLEMCHDEPNIVNKMLINRFKIAKNDINVDNKFIQNPTTDTDTYIDKESECPICFDQLKKDDNVVLKCPDCLKCIHSECVSKWLEYNKNCPLCRSTVWSGLNKNTYLNIG